MVMSRRNQDLQEALFITALDLPKSAGHPFYQALNRLPAEADFDRWVETRCGRSRASRHAPCAANAQTARASSPGDEFRSRMKLHRFNGGTILSAADKTLCKTIHGPRLRAILALTAERRYEARDRKSVV